MHNHLPDPAAAAPRGTLIVKRGGIDFFFLSFFLSFFFELAGHAEVSVEGTTGLGAISAVAFCCRVRAMLVWQGDGWGKTQEGWQRKRMGVVGWVVYSGVCRVL